MLNDKDIIPLDGISASFLRAIKSFPYLKDGSYYVKVPSENDLVVVDLLEKKLGIKFIPEYADEEIIFELIQKYYENLLDIQPLEEEKIEDINLLKDLASEAPIIRLVNKIIREAVENRATDVHFESSKKGLRVRFRIDGILHDKYFYPPKFIAPVISRLKLMAKLNIAEYRLPQDGRIKFRVSGKDIDIRISVIPSVFGEGVVLRLLVQEEQLLSLQNLGLSPENYQQILHLLRMPNGIILVTGPTGSGKTTTLYASLSYLNTPDKKIITIEDPVEYQLSGIHQIQIRPEIGLTFASALRSILRHDPDIILVGEIRDYETAEIAIQAALTGHLVFSTLHTNDALGAVFRLHEMGIEKYLISASVVGLIAQRLVRKLCEKCSKVVDPDDAFLEALSRVDYHPDNIIFKVPVGCDFCSNTGYYGREAIYEIIVIDKMLRKLILKSDEDDIRNYLKKQKFRSLFYDGLRKVCQGVTSFEEVLRVSRIQS